MSSVVIVSYRTPALTLAAAQSAASSGATHVVVVDNASGDSTLDELRGATDAEIIVNPTNAGFGAAANLGASRSRGDVLVFLNSDAQLTRDALEAMRLEVEMLGGHVLVGPRLVGGDGSIQRSAGLLPTPRDLAVRSLGLHRVAAAVMRFPMLRRLAASTDLAREYESAPSADSTIDTTMVSGACFAIGRSAFDELGGFDERFFMYFEDADLCRRALDVGMRIRYVPSAVVPHVGGASSPEDYHFGPRHARAMRQYLEKWYGPGGSAFALLLLWLRAAGMSVGLRSGAKRAWRAWWAAARDEDPRRSRAA
jgi:GT2 family glycosyltransferase